MQKAPHTCPETHRLQTLLDAARLLNSTLELKELTGIILAVVRAEFPIERMSVFVIDRDRNMLQSLVAQDVDDSEISFPLGCGIAGAAAGAGEILDILDAYEDPRFDPRFDGKLGFHTKDLFVLPVSNRSGDIVGVLELLNRSRPIAAADREFLLGISVYIGLALENAWLHSQVLVKEKLELELTDVRDRLAETEKQSLMSGMLEEIRRESNNPLTAAVDYAALARDQLGLPAQVRVCLDQITFGIDRTAMAARKFQEFVETQEQERVSMDLGAALRQLSNLRAREWVRNNIETALILETGPPVLAHQDQMQLVLFYLIKNAEDSAVLSKGRRALRIHLSRNNQQVRVEIRDSGAGIAVDLQPDFTQRLMAPKAGSGAGLRLAIAAAIVQQHNGRIRFKHDLGEGSTVTVELPVHGNGVSGNSSLKE